MKRRITRAKRAEAIKEIYGSFYDEQKNRIRYARNGNERRLLSTLNKLYKIKVEMGEKNMKGGINDELHGMELERVSQLHKRAVKITNIIKDNEHLFDTIPIIDVAKVKEINDMVEGFNQYMDRNELVKLKYKRFEQIIIPEKVIQYEKIKKNDSYQVKTFVIHSTSSTSPVGRSPTLLDNTSVEDLKTRPREGASITSTHQVYNKKENQDMERMRSDTENKYWLCNKCGFGHMLFSEVI